MGAQADDYLADTGLSAADRAVMEFLYPEEELSVPDIARRYDVSRQHVQVTVNGLVRQRVCSQRSESKAQTFAPDPSEQPGP